ncbi:MAG: EamA family transporter [Nitrospinae bacterium]|nr:EamA family transporter [Nitrospinota bacterium]
MSDDSRYARNALTGAFIVFLAAAAFSAKAVLVKLAYRYHTDALTVLTLRMLFALPFFIAMAVWGERSATARVSRRDFALIAVLGLTGFYLSAYLDFLGLEYVSAGLERLILFLYPTFVVLLSAFFMGRRITRRDLFALALCYAGAALAFFHEARLEGSNVGLGAGLIAFCTLAYAVYLVAGAEVIKRTGPVRFTAYVMIVSSAAVLAHYAVERGIVPPNVSTEVVHITLFMAVAATVFPVFLMSEGLRRIGASRAAIISSVGPVITIFLAYAVLGEQVSAMQIAGTALIIAGVLAVSGKAE